VRLLQWAFRQESALIIQGIGFWLGILGFLITLIGFFITFRKISGAKKAAEDLKAEIGKIKISLDRYDVAHEASRANASLLYAAKSINNRSWQELSSSYAEFLKSIFIIRELKIQELQGMDGRISEAKDYAEKICERAEANTGGAMSAREAAKLNSMVRKNELLLSSIKVAMQRSQLT
jgi:hypothetical protein